MSVAKYDERKKCYVITVHSDYAHDRLLEQLEAEGRQLRSVVRYSSNHIVVMYI